jgi:hypothetical protein
VNNTDSAATLSDRNDTRITRNQTKQTARVWMKVLFVTGAGALLSAVLQGGEISTWIVAALCFGTGSVIGICNW